ncbi:hypothetical protein IFR05_002883 [Cadophora sp. M221]|nr:hypothetical protein IFR05_002883 [Cadophora sp. M221]
MSGLEGISIALGILPLLISALEHYEDVFRPFQRYRDFFPELARFQRQLLAQKTIFRSQCQLLLAPLTGVEMTTLMLNGKRHHMWESGDMASRLKSHLGQSAEACVATMTEMEEQLYEIQEKAQEFIPPESTSTKAWRTHFKKKLKFSISGPTIERCINNLRNLNKDFSALSAQTTEFLSMGTSNARLSESISAVKKCQRIQQASTQFYEALQAACSSHQQHLAHLQVIEPSIVRLGHALEYSGVQFSVGLSEDDGIKSKSHHTPVWLAVHSIFDSISLSQNCLGGGISSIDKVTKLQLALKRGPSPIPESINCKKPKCRKKLTAIETPLAAGLDSPGKPSSPYEPSNLKSSQPRTIQSGPPRVATSMPNFCDARDLCLHITRACKRPFGGLNSCFGHLKVSSITHELYLEDQGCHVEGAMSLNELMSSTAERHRTDPLDRLPLLECIRVARNVAFSVLQFHSTPLLNP